MGLTSYELSSRIEEDNRHTEDTSRRLVLIQRPWLLQFDGIQPRALYNLRTDPRQTTDLKDQPNTPLPAMLLRLKAYLQEYTHRMRENRLISLEPSR